MTFRIWSAEDVVRNGQSGAAIGSENNVVAMLPNGGYVAGFVAGNALYFQRYDGAGYKVGGPALVAPGTATRDGFDIQVFDAEGYFAVTWNEIDGTNSSVKSRTFDINGSLPSNIRDVAGFVSNSGSDAPSVVGNAAGGFVSVFNDPTTQGGVRLSVHDASGNAALPHSVTVDSGRRGDVAEITPNRYIVSYNYTTSAGTHTPGVYYALLDLTNPGVPALFPEVRVGGGSASASDVIALEDGNGNPSGFAVLCNTGRVLTLSRYDALGNLAGTVEITNLGEASDDKIDFFNVTALRDGRMAVVYSSANGTDKGDIFVRVLNADGTLNADNPLLLNMSAATDGTSAQLTPSVTEMADGRLAVTWHDRTSSNGHISTTVVDARIAAVTVNGTAGDDIYAGSDYNGNILNGLGGNDRLIGGLGSDAIDGGEGIDAASYERSAGGVSVSLAGGPGVGGDADGDTYAAIENLMGSQYADYLTGNDGANYLWGLGGNDVFISGGGADVFDGGAGNDIYYVDSSDRIVESAGAGFDTVYTHASFSLASMAGVEKLVVTGTAAATVTGNAEANILYGNAGYDKLYGNTGNDSLFGGAGNDYLRGDAGNDKLYGGTYNDALWGSAGNDSLYGEAGNDVLHGDAGNDALSGGTHNDRLSGGAGKDVLTGGTGRDIFVFNTALNRATNLDKITDFTVRDDTIWLDNRYMAKLGPGTEARPGRLKPAFLAFDTTKDTNDYLVYVRKSGKLMYDPDGSGAKAAVEIAVLKPGLKLTYADFQVI
jgi:Ca2+-binding RTX toxin-like protein